MNRVVITGVGCITPLGNSYDQVVAAMYAGTSGVKFNEVYQANTARVELGHSNINDQFDRYDTAATSLFARATMLA